MITPATPVHDSPPVAGEPASPPLASKLAAQPLASKLAFVDVETTGSSPARGRVTEVGIVTVQWPHPYAGPPRVVHWASLINPGVPIPPEIQFLTGIDQSMLADQPEFAAVADTIEHHLQDAVFVAHHARFDYGFIKAEMARAGRLFQARTLCTVRLSRALTDHAESHSLDAVILRNGLRCIERHRALGDAEVLWQFVQSLVNEHGAEPVFATARRLISRPNLPAHLNIASVEALPAGPGIYFFHGLNEHPLYIGKSINIRQRIASHFCTDYQSERGLRLASETRRLSWQETAGEFSALLAEIQAIERYQPAHNRALRSHQQAWFVGFGEQSVQPQFIRLESLQPEQLHNGMLNGLLGPFASRSAARQRLIAHGREFGWCLATLGLEKAEPGAPCFARQLQRCAGACIGEQTHQALLERIHADLLPHNVPDWPDARLLLIEQDTERELMSWHCFEQWHWLQSGSEQASLTEWLTRTEPTTQDRAVRFNRHVQALLLKTLRGRKRTPLNLWTQLPSRAPESLPLTPEFDDEQHWVHRKKGTALISWCWLARPVRNQPPE